MWIIEHVGIMVKKIVFIIHIDFFPGDSQKTPLTHSMDANVII